MPSDMKCVNWAFETCPEKLLQKCVSNRDGTIWSDDCFEIMLVCDPKARIYYQIGVNSLGKCQVLYHEGGKPGVAVDNFKMETSAQTASDRWSVEMKIPLEQFKAYNFEALWQINIFRTRVLNNPLQEAVNRQASGLRIFGNSYHSVDQYHYLKWPAETVPKKNFWDFLLFR